jgi:transcriptional regulator with XRE-family HTH domain
MARLDVSSLGSYIREQRTNAELSIRELARVTGVSNPYLSQVERGIRQPSAQTLSRVADALRISAEQLYVRAGFLERTHEHSVRAAIAEDPYLTEAQRKDLLRRYEAHIGSAVEKPLKSVSAKTPTKKSASAKSSATKATTARAATTKVAASKTPSSKASRTERGRS